MSTTLYGFLKFVSPEFEKDFLDGNLYMKSLQYFIDEEATHGAGRGDKYEASWIMKPLSIKIGDVTIEEKDIKEVSIRSHEFSNAPVYCMFAIEEKHIQRDSETNLSKVVIPKQELELIINEFGNNAFYVPAAEFLKRVENACDSQKIHVANGLVAYYDTSLNDAEYTNRVKDIFNVNVAYTKKIEFKHQNEYRFLKLNQTITPDSYDYLKIGDLRDIATKVEFDHVNKDSIKNILFRN